VSGSLALVRLLQLASPALPVGAYTYSQGLEQAADTGVVRDEAGARRWIGDGLTFVVARWEAPLVASLHRAWSAGDDATVGRLDLEFVASRETSELRAETLQMGHSLRRVLRELPAFASLERWPGRLDALAEPAFPTAWSAAAAAWEVAERDAVVAYLWSWLENQAMAAIKCVPLGQSAGQRLLADLGARLPALAEEACGLHEPAFANFAPGAAITCAAHETQYSRLFRS
jgi:urease accessory protein